MSVVKELIRTEADGTISFGAVSYTHLDVYKRQLSGRPISLVDRGPSDSGGPYRPGNI